MATGVKALRPPDQIAAHQAATTTSPHAKPTPRVSVAGTSRPRSPTRLAAQSAEGQAEGRENHAL